MRVVPNGLRFTFESALAYGEKGFTEPKPCCNHCNAYLDLDKILDKE